MEGDEKHSGAANSTLDVLWVLYDRVLQRHAGDDQRPRARPLPALQGPRPGLLLRGAGGQGLHRSETFCATFGEFDSRLGHHPDRSLIPGVEIASGSLGHGLPLAVGMVLALDAAPNRARASSASSATLSSTRARTARRSRLPDGSVWTRLTVVAIDNKSSTYGWPGGIEQRFAVEGWSLAPCATVATTQRSSAH